MVAKLTGDDLYAWALVLHNVDKRTIVLVEGETDASAIDPHLSDADCQSIIGNGKEAVSRAAKIAKEESHKSIIGLIDRDFVGVLDVSDQPENLFLTDSYDLDSTILSFPDIVERVVSSHCQRASLGTHRPEETYLTPAVKPCRVVSALRAHCKQSGMECSLRDFPMHAVLDRKTGELDVNRFVKIVQSRCSDTHIPTEAELLQGVSTGLALLPEGSSFCSGHDLLAALAFLMHNRWGASAISGPNLGRIVRSSFDCHHLGQTKFYGDIRDWSLQSKRQVWRCAHIPAQRDPLDESN